MSQTQTLEIVEISVDKIRPSPYQPRLDFDLEELRGSIIKYGIRDPLKIRQVEDHWELIDGERRWRIAKQESMKTVPCLVLNYTNDEADALSWRFNTERKEYSLEERAKHFKKHQNEGLSGSAIGRIHGYSKQQVNRLLAIFRLPEKYQNYMWTGEFAVQKFEYLYGKGLINDKSVSFETEAIKIIDEAIERRLTQREFENVIDDYFTDLEKRQVEEAKKVATQLEVSKQREDKAREALGKPEVKEPETPEELERAAEALKKEAEKRKTPEQRAEEKRQKLITQARKSLNSVVKKIDGARKIIVVGTFRKRLNELEKALEQNPTEVREQLITLGKEVIEAKKQRQKEVEEEKRKKREEEERRRLEEEMQKKLEEEARKKADEEFKRKLEAERRRVEEEAKERLLEDRKILEEAEEKLKKIRFEELKARREEEQIVKRPQINLLNELAGDEWLKFTKSWYVFDALESDLAEERVITAGLTEEHPATFSPTMISDYVRFFTKRDAVVLDPFVGIGSTLVACTRTGRRGIGIDLNGEYADIARKRVEGDPKQRVIHGDAWGIEKYGLPKIDYCVTSPPYFRMLEKIDVTQKRRIRKGLATDYGDSVALPEEVDEYVNELVDLFSKIAKITKENGYATVIIQNFRDQGRMVPLAWQFAIAMQKRGDWIFKGEKLWLQDHKNLHPFGQKFDFVSNIHHHYCLIFKKARK